jgi:colicin import membrane protein
MTVRSIPRTVVTESVKLARFPVDTVVRTAPGISDSTRDRIGLTVDRWEAGVRQIAGTLLADDELRRGAKRQEAAIDLRADAAELKEEADLVTKAAADDLQRRVATATQTRTEADRRADERAERAKAKASQGRRQAQTTEGRRRAASRDAATAAEEEIDRTARRERLEVLDHEAEVLAERTQALDAKNEAQRLRRAASRTKSARKANTNRPNTTT